MYSSKDSYLIEKHFNGSGSNLRRLSTSGFEYPNELSHVQYPRNFSTISEEKIQPSMINIPQFHNGAKKSEFVGPNFFSENNINISNQCNSSFRNMMSTSHSIAIDSRLNYSDHTSIPRFISTPIIATTTIEDSSHNNNFVDVKNYSNVNYPIDSQNYMPNCPVTSNDQHNQYNPRCEDSLRSNNPYYNEFNNSAYMASTCLIYDPQSNTFRNVLIVPQMMPMLSQSIEMNDSHYYLQNNNARNLQNEVCPNYDSISSSEAMNYTEQFQQNPTYVESNGFMHKEKEDYHFDQHMEIREDMDEIPQTESESTQSLNMGGDSEDYSTEDDQIDTIHDNQMFEEQMKNLSSVFTNIVSVSLMSQNNNVSGPSELLNRSELLNSSRFKKTRIKERTTLWNNKQAIVKDNLVKIIPDEILKIPFIENELNKFKEEIFGDQLSSSDHEEKNLDSVECVHSIRQGSSGFRVHKHSNRNNQWCRTSVAPLSLNELTHPSNLLHKSNISRHNNHRKSVQIPFNLPIIQIPIKKIIPLLSPVISHCNKPLFDQSNTKNMKRRERRWSVSCSRLDSGSSNSIRTNGMNHQCESPHDSLREFTEGQHCEDTADKETQLFLNSLESRLDHHLFCLKRSLIAQFDSCLRDMRSEIKSMRNTQTELESQLSFYKNRLDSMKQTIKNCLPEDEWKSFDIGIDLES